MWSSTGNAFCFAKVVDKPKVWAYQMIRGHYSLLAHRKLNYRPAEEPCWCFLDFEDVAVVEAALAASPASVIRSPLWPLFPLPLVSRLAIIPPEDEDLSNAAALQQWTSINCNTCSRFFVACTRLYKPLCRSVGQSVGPSLNARSTWLMAIGLVTLSIQPFSSVFSNYWLHQSVSSQS